MAGERLTFIWHDDYGDARPSKTTNDIFKKWDTFCEQDPNYSIYCIAFLSDVISELQQKYDYFCQRELLSMLNFVNAKFCQL